MKPDFIPSIQYPSSDEKIFLQTTPFPLETNIQKWTLQATDFFEDLPAKLILEDKDGTQWVSLNLYDELATKKFADDNLDILKGKQIIWLMAKGYLVNLGVYELLKKDYAPGFWGGDISQGVNVYQLFNREYSWSPGYHSIFQPGQFETEIKIGEKALIKKNCGDASACSKGRRRY